MKCPKCNTTMLDKCCPRCGYLSSGFKVNLKDGPEKFIDEKNYNKDFDTLYRNSNKIYPFIFTGYYIAFHKYFIVGLLTIMLKWACVIGLNYYFSSIPILCEYSFLICLLFIVGYHMLMGAIANTIILYFDKKKIKRIKKKYPKDYSKYLFKNNSTSIVPLLLIVLVYMLFFIWLRMR